MRDSLNRRGIVATVDTVLTKEPGHAVHLAADARDVYDIIVAVGGDGTAREVAGGLRGGTACLGILPNGTANVLAADLGIPLRLTGAADLLAPDAPTVSLDLGEINDRPFVLNVGVGYAARLIINTPTRLKRRVGFLAYLPAAVHAAFAHDRGIATVTMGERQYRGRVQMVFVGNSGGIGGNLIYIAPNVHPNDGQLTVTIFGPRSPLSTLWTFGQLILRRYDAIHHATYWRGTEVTITSDFPLPVEVDGDAAGTTPCTVRLFPAALLVIAPEKRGKTRENARLATKSPNHQARKVQGEQDKETTSFLERVSADHSFLPLSVLVAWWLISLPSHSAGMCDGR